MTGSRPATAGLRGTCVTKTPPNTTMNVPKQVIIVRKDLNMPTGKLAAQVAHASIAFLTGRFRAVGMLTMGMLPPAQQEWVSESFTKVIVWVADEAEFWQVVRDARAAGLGVDVIEDEGRTVFNGQKTFTCAAIGPDFADKIDPITRHLKLVR